MPLHLPLSCVLEPLEALAEAEPIHSEHLIRPSYGRYLEDFEVGQVFAHPRSVMLDTSLVLAYARTFMEHHPAYLSEDAARAWGFPKLPVCPSLVMNVAISLGVQNDSEKTLANLGYWDLRFLRPVYVGETLTAMTRVCEVRERGQGPGIVTIETIALSQEQVVLQFRRKMMIPRRPEGQPPHPYEACERPFPWRDPVRVELAPFHLEPHAIEMGHPLEAGQIWLHPKGRTITDAHLDWTWRLGNTHPLHNDRVYAKAAAGPVSGEPVVYGGLVFAWLLGLASRDISAYALAELGYHAGFHTQPAFSGDTLYALSRVLAVRPGPMEGTQRVQLQLVGVKNISSEVAWARYGGELFRREDTKRERGEAKIAEKVFEIERELLIALKA